MGKRKPPKLDSTNLEDLFMLSEPEKMQPEPRKRSNSTSKETTTQNRLTPSSPTHTEPSTEQGMGLEDWLEQSNELRQENERLKAEATAALENLQTERAAHEVALRQKQMALQDLEVERSRLEALLVEQRQRFDLETQQLQLVQQGLEEEARQNVATIDLLESSLQVERQSQQHQEDNKILQDLLSERGLRTHAEFTAFVKAMGESTHCWNFFKDALLPKAYTTSFLESEVHLMAEGIQDVSSIAGVCVPVSADKCEVSAGVDLTIELREVVTEMMLRGWNKLLIVGIQRSFVTFLRNAFGENSIDVQVDAREEAWQYSDEMNGYPAVLVIGGGAERIPAHCTATIFDSASSHIGTALSDFRIALQHVEEEE